MIYDRNQQSIAQTTEIIQPQLEIGEENDEFEKEANAVAEKVTSSSGTGNNGEDEVSKKKKMVSGSTVQPMKIPEQRKVKSMSTGTSLIRKMSTGKSGGMTAPAKVEQGIQNSKGGGQHLPTDVQNEMGSKIGNDFSNVKIHTDSNSVKMNKEIGAKAFTHGSDIYFNSNQYNPDSGEGKHLLAHELTHTVQQQGTIQPKIQRQTLTNAVNLISAGNVQAGLADPDMRLVLSTAGGKKIDVAILGADVNLNNIIANGLGIAPIPPVSGNPPFSQYSTLQRSTIAYTLGMLKTRQDYIDNNNAYLVNVANPASPNPATDFMSSSLNYNYMLAQVKLDPNPAIAIAPGGWAFNMISENPDMSVMEKALFLNQLSIDIPRASGTATSGNPGNLGSGTAAAAVSGFMPQLSNILNDQNRVKGLIDTQAQAIFSDMGIPAGTVVGQSVLASSGDTGMSRGMFGSGATAGTSVGVGYFMYSASAGTPVEQGLIGNNITIGYPATLNQLEIMLNAYGFDRAGTVMTISITAGTGSSVQNFRITINGPATAGGTVGSTNTSASSIPGITVTPYTTGSATGAYLSLDNTYQGSPVTINVSRGLSIPASGTITDQDEVQLMVTTNGELGSLVTSLEAKELFDSGSFISKSIPTLQNSARKSDQDLAQKIIDFSASLNVNQITALLTSTTTGNTADFSSFFNLSGKGINTNAPIPQKFRDDNPGQTDLQLLKRIELLDKGKLTSYYQSDSRFSAMNYEEIIAMLEEYRSSSANASGGINITSTTDPQGTGKNEGPNNDFPDYFNEYIKGTVFGNAVTPLLNMNGNEISRENNDALSALRSLSFLKLILEQKGLTETDFAKMNVKVKVGATTLPANLGEIPTEASASRSTKASRERKKLSGANVSNYCIQVMSGQSLDGLNKQKGIYENRGWTCRLEPAGDGKNTRLLVEKFANVNDAMDILQKIWADGWPKAFIRTEQE